MSEAVEGRVEMEQYVFTKRSSESSYEWFGPSAERRAVAAALFALFQRGNWTPPAHQRRIFASFSTEVAAERWWVVIDQERNVAGGGRQYHRTRMVMVRWSELVRLGGAAPVFDALVKSGAMGADERAPSLVAVPDPEAAREASARCEAALGDAHWNALVTACERGQRVAIPAEAMSSALSLRDLHAALFAKLPVSRWARLGAIDAGVCADASVFELFLRAKPWSGSRVRSLLALVGPTHGGEAIDASLPTVVMPTIRQAAITADERVTTWYRTVASSRAVGALQAREVVASTSSEVSSEPSLPPVVEAPRHRRRARRPLRVALLATCVIAAGFGYGAQSRPEPPASVRVDATAAARTSPSALTEFEQAVIAAAAEPSVSSTTPEDAELVDVSPVVAIVVARPGPTPAARGSRVVARNRSAAAVTSETSITTESPYPEVSTDAGAASAEGADWEGLRDPWMPNDASAPSDVAR